MNITQMLTEEFKVRQEQVEAMIALLDAGNTIPFIARYRKEATGGLDDSQLRDMSERLEYLRGMDKRREEIREALIKQEVLTEELSQKLDNAQTMTALEDIYLPFRPKRRTRAMIAIEKGLEPFAAWLMAQYPKGDIESQAQKYIDEEKGVHTAEEAVDGARDILAETVSEDADTRSLLRSMIVQRGVVATAKEKDEDSVYSMYYEFSEPVSRIAPHRVLAINRGEKEEFLKVNINIDDETVVSAIKRRFVKGDCPASAIVSEACEDAWKRLLSPSLKNDVRNMLTDKANEQAIKVFSDNLHQLLMQPPIKGKVTLGVDPGFRTGCKLAVVDENGKVLETGVGHFTIPGQDRAKEQSANLIKGMIRRHSVTAIAIGNGTASRESEQFIADLISDLKGVGYVIVSEAGASVYSASKLGAAEFPEYDVSLRSAVSIARRMQDPLAELVKIDPKAIGVGQYQHDLKQNELTDALDGVVEQCVNSVGVELSTASAQLLSHVAGIGPTLAKNIVAYREENGFSSRAELKKVSKLGPKAFEQCAGFLRVADSKNPLDGSGVHPESYDAAKKLLAALGYALKDMKNGGIADIRVKAEEYGLDKLCEELSIGKMTLSDILDELKKPGRDPREDLPQPLLRKDVLALEDLKPGMELTGTVRNVIDFGAFVDIGVHQDGLVHISRMANRFIRHPSEAVKVGDIVKVWVVEVDIRKKRIALTMVKEKAEANA